MKMEVLKKLLILDYIILGILLVCTLCFPAVDLVTIIVAWIAQIGITTGAYAWKAKNENRIKIPFKVIESLPEDMRGQLELTSIIIAIIQSE